MTTGSVVKSFLCVSIVWAVASSAMASNLFDNPGFETGALDPWHNTYSYGGYVPWHVTSDVVHTGSYSAVAQGEIRLQQDISPTPASEIEEVSFWLAFSEGSLWTVPYFCYADGTSNGWIEFNFTTDWAYHNVTSHLDRGKTLTGFGISSSWNLPAWVYFDDAVISVVPEPATFTTLCVGAMLLSKGRRTE